MGEDTRWALDNAGLFVEAAWRAAEAGQHEDARRLRAWAETMRLLSDAHERAERVARGSVVSGAR